MRKRKGLQSLGLVKMNLTGGIGNQFFMLFAGLYLASRSGRRLKVYSSQNTKAFGIHGSTLTKFDFSDYADFEEGLVPNSYKHRFISYLNRRLNIISGILTFVFKYYESPVFGFDKFLEKINGPVFIKGYFQTYIYAKKFLLVNSSFRITLIQPSSKYLELHSQLVNSSVTVIHIRLGDYLLHQESIGVLSSEYYNEACRKVNMATSKVVIFSDDIIRARKMIGHFVPNNSLWLGKEDLAAEESLALMWLGEEYVLSNSSFGFWGAMLSNKPKKVIAPEPWFRGGNSPENLYPVEWLRITSKWSSTNSNQS